jgi:iron complex outermembrane receptor protein
MRAGGSPTGNILQAGTGYFNGVGFNIEGVDLTLTGSVETDFGDFSFNMVNSFILTYASDTGGDSVNTAGWSDRPDYRSTTTLGWSYDAFSVTWNSNYVAGTSEFEQYNAETEKYDITGELDSYLIHNLSVAYDASEYGRVSLTIANLTDEDPVLSSAGSFTNPSLYSNLGQDVRVSYTISF